MKYRMTIMPMTDDIAILCSNIEDDGLETVKNQGRQDIKDRWQEKEDYWVEAIHNGEDSRYGTKQIIDPKQHLSYQKPEAPFEIFEEDFVYLCNSIAPDNRVKEDIKQLFANHPKIPVFMLGFTNEWQNHPLWK